MTENPAASTNEAAELLSTVTQTQKRVREATQHGGWTDFVGIWAAEAVAQLVTIRHGFGDAAFPLVRAGIWVVLFAAAVRRRKNLGGQIGAPTWAAVGTVFVADVVIALATHGETRDVLTSTMLGLAMLFVGVVYRRASTVLFGVLFAIAGPAVEFEWPLALWLPPLLAVSLVGSAFLGRDQIRDQFRQWRNR